MTAEQLGQLFNYGILGLLVLLLIFEKLVPEGRLKREENLTDKAIGAVDRQTEVIRQLVTAQEAENRINEQRGKP